MTKTTKTYFIALLLVIITVFCFVIFNYFDNNIAYADDELQPINYDVYTDSDFILNNSSYTIRDYKTHLYKTTTTLQPNNSLSITDDDPITGIVPKILFSVNGNHLYIGKEYGFFISTKPQTYQISESSPQIVSASNKHCTVIVFDISVGYEIDRYNISVEPLFQYEYAYVTPEENYVTTCPRNVSKYYSKKINYNINENYVIPLCRMHEITGIMYYEEVISYYLKDISFGIQLLNEQAPNDIPPCSQYVAANDAGSFIIGLDYSFSGVTVNGQSIDAQEIISYVGGWLGLAGTIASLAGGPVGAALGSVLGVMGTILTLPDLLNPPTSNKCNQISVSSGMITATPLYTTRQHQITNYGKLIKEAGITINSDLDTPLLFNTGTSANAIFAISNSSPEAQEENQTRIIHDLALHIVDAETKNIVATDVGSYYDIYGQNISTICNIGVSEPLYLLPCGINYFTFAPEFSSTYTFLFDSNVNTLKINDSIINITNNIAEIFLGKGQDYSIQCINGDSINYSSFTIEPNANNESLIINKNDEYIVKYNFADSKIYNLNTSIADVKIKKIYNVINNNLTEYKFANHDITETSSLQIPITAGTKYIVLKNTSSTEQNVNLQVSSAANLSTGNNLNLQFNNNWIYYYYKATSNNDYVITFSMVNSSLATNVWNNNYNEISHISASDSITISSLQKNQKIIIGYKNNNSQNGTGKITINTYANAFKWKINGTNISGQTKSLERGSQYQLEFWINNITKITTFEKSQGGNHFSINDNGSIYIDSDCPTTTNYIQIRAFASNNTSYTYYLNITPTDEKKIIISGQLNTDTQLGFKWQTNADGISKFTYKVSNNSTARTILITESTGNVNILSLINPASYSQVSITITSITINGTTRPYDSQYATITISTRFGGGDGTESSPYIIASPRHFNNIKYVSNINNSNRNNEHFKQTEKIDFNNTATARNVDFYGTYISNNKKILNINIEDNSSIVGGLFRYNYGTISGLTFVGTTIVSSSTNAIIGGMVGINANGAQLHAAIITTGSITAENLTNQAGYVGGVVGINKGYIKGGMIGYTIKSKCNIGQVAGLNDTTGTIEDGIISGTIEYSNQANYYIGGIVGHNKGIITVSDSSTEIIIVCELKYTAETSSSRELAPYIGYVVGYNDGGAFSNCTWENASIDTGTLHTETWTTGALFWKKTHTWDQKQNATGNAAGGSV